MLPVNAGYIRNKNRLDERENLWHLALAAEVEVFRKTKLVANMGMDRNTDRTSNTDPAFIPGGVIYSLSENIDLDAGIKGGLNRPETDLTILTGIAVLKAGRIEEPYSPARAGREYAPCCGSMLIDETHFFLIKPLILKIEMAYHG